MKGKKQVDVVDIGRASRGSRGVEEKKIQPTLAQMSAALKEIKDLLHEFIDTSESNIQIIALWILGTYLHNQFETFPLLQFYAQKRSGKTRSLKLISSIGHLGDGSVRTSITEAGLFRHKEGVMCFDEMESVTVKGKEAFRETLNTVYKKGNKIIRYVERKNKEGAWEFVEEAYYPFYPLALAGTQGLGDILEDRAIQVILQRSSKPLTKLIEDFSTNKKIIALKVALSELKAEIPQNLFSEWNAFVRKEPLQNTKLTAFFQKIDQVNIVGRPFELFLPLFVIAWLCDDLDSFLKTAQEYVATKEEEAQAGDIDEILKNFLKKSNYLSYVNLSTILEGFKTCLDNPEDWVNAKWLGRAIKRLGFQDKTRLVNGKTQVKIKLSLPNSTTSTTSTKSTQVYQEEKEVKEDSDNELI